MSILTARGKVTDLRAMLIVELEDFVTRHCACGTMTGEATEPEANGYSIA